MDIACKRCDVRNIFDVRFAVQYSLIQMRNGPTLRDVEAEFRRKLLGCLAGHGVLPGAERGQQVPVLVEGQIAVHHAGNAHGRNGAGQFAEVANGGAQAGLHILHMIRPDAVFQTAFPCVITAFDNAVLAVDQDGLDARGTELNSKIILFHSNLLDRRFWIFCFYHNSICLFCLADWGKNSACFLAAARVILEETANWRCERRYNMLLIQNAHIKTMAGADIPNGCLLIEDGKIAAVAPEIDAPVGAKVIDAQGRLLTPGCVEAHCHIGLDNQSMRWEGMDYNEIVDPLTPQLRAIDSINPQDEAFGLALRGGVTTACTGPGSANVVGGTFAILKLAGKRVDKMVLRSPAAMKCAFGENPKGCYGQNKKQSPMTRMAVAGLLRELLMRTIRYRDDKAAGKNPPLDMKLEAMLPVVNGEIPIKCHAHRADDILTAVRIAREFHLKLTLDHCTDGEVIADELAEEGYPVFVGPSLGSKSKVELRNKSFTTAGVLYRAGLTVSIITDAPVIPLQYLPLAAGLAAAAGLPMEEAWHAITINPAKSLGIADRVGSLEPGKDADLVLWTADPLTTIGGEAYMTIVNGEIVYQAE